MRQPIWYETGQAEVGENFGWKKSQRGSIRQDRQNLAVKWPILLTFVMVILCLEGPGCSGLRSDSPESDTVPISDVGTVAGKWKGTLKKVPGVFPVGTVRLNIRENGTFLFSNDRLIDIRVGAGRLTKQDGMLISDEGRRHVTFTLHETHGTQMLIAEGFAPSGDQFYAEFRRED